jgi:ornithine carbamoyltransferase
MWRKDLLTEADLTQDDLNELFALVKDVKANPGNYRQALAGKTLGMIFHKPSTRTRVSFEVGMYQLGGNGMFFNQNDLQLGKSESVSDTAKVLSRFLDGIMIRTFKHSDVETLAKNASIPVINGLTDSFHPCQGLTDLFTMRENVGPLQGLKMSYIGDGSSNMAHSLMLSAAVMGIDLRVVCPKAYSPDAAVMKRALAIAARHGGKIEVVVDPKAGVKGAKVVYTDVWTSMGQEAETAKRKKDLGAYQVNPKLMANADPDWVFMHCLPAHRGEEVVDEICDDPRSVIFDEAENRMHVQKGILIKLMGKR